VLLPDQPSPYWCCARWEPGRERLALHHLKRGGFETYFPIIRAQRRTSNGRRFEDSAGLFGVYGFVLLVAGRWYDARWSLGVYVVEPTERHRTGKHEPQLDRDTDDHSADDYSTGEPEHGFGERQSESEIADMDARLTGMSMLLRGTTLRFMRSYDASPSTGPRRKNRGY
jgi:hypothetical protein